jgi:hypothetical protein
MRHDPSYFRFAANLEGRINGKSFYYRLPGDIVRKDDLFQTLYAALWLPVYFSFDWDALYDCLCDFSWMADRKIVLIHDALPRLPEAELRLYLLILRDAVRWWRMDDPHQLEVIFSERDRLRVEALLGGE